MIILRACISECVQRNSQSEQNTLLLSMTLPNKVEQTIST